MATYTNAVLPFLIGFLSGVSGSLLTYIMYSKAESYNRSIEYFKIQTYIQDDWNVYEIPNKSHTWKTSASNIEKLASDNPSIIKYRIPADYTMSFIFH